MLWDRLLRADVMQKIRSLLFGFLWSLWTVVVFGLLLIVLIAVQAGPVTVRKCSRVWARGVLFLLRVLTGIRHEIHGAENLPKEPCLIVCNHQSAWETIAFLLVVPDVAIITKIELLKIPVFGVYLKRSPMIPIDRDSGTKAIRKMIEDGQAAVKDGRSVLIFPEGTRQAPGTKIEFKRGVELLAAKLGLPLVPAAMNSGEFWLPGNQPKRAGVIQLTILPAIPATTPAQEAVAQAEAAVQRTLDNLRA